MKSLILLLAICGLGYVADHWQELTTKGEPLSRACRCRHLWRPFLRGFCESWRSN